MVRENPADYIARYGDSLFDSATLVQMARNAGVFEDLVLSFQIILTKNLIKPFCYSRLRYCHIRIYVKVLLIMTYQMEAETDMVSLVCTLYPILF